MNIFALIGVIVVSVVAYLLVLVILMLLIGGAPIDSKQATIGSIILGVTEAVTIGLLLVKIRGVL